MSESKTTAQTKTKKKVETKVETAKPVFTPPSGIVSCAPIKRTRKGNPVSHETNFKYGDAHSGYVLPTTSVSGRLRFINLCNCSS